MSAYTVQPGDTLSAIAAQHGVTVAEIAAVNGITNVNLITAGQNLKIPNQTPVPTLQMVHANSTPQYIFPRSISSLMSIINLGFADAPPASCMSCCPMLVAEDNNHASPTIGERSEGVRQAEEENSLQPLFDIIAKAESGGDYDIVYYGSKIRPSKNITEMTVAEVIKWQEESRNAGSASSAVGKYQIIYSTLKEQTEKLGIEDSRKFDVATQDEIATSLLERRGLNEYLLGKMDRESFGNSLAKEWAGLAVLSGTKRGGQEISRGQSYYAKDGLNKATVTAEEIEKALDQIIQ